MLDQISAGRRQRQPVWRPVEQAHAELVLKGGDMPAHGRLAATSGAGGAGQGSVLGDRQEGLQVGPIEVAHHWVSKID